ncbi:polysaccharide pyruvyl transferase family protein [Thermohalobacter berrensis]|uniref:Polysaccharide pyruvyl transferase domain-containing protein n=1 Tax=Thermohalobacter berrensis TaxID=99594 RepID=A0A419T4D0_9FIRM|nr:polysaccharide pyruvyl transferase family protein [Thermohalobacter berrensis]RKD32276.1 hypothetical protein BET03_02895 [Thermohalobacter berrensis]
MQKKTIGITATDFAGNKGAAAMLQAIVKNVSAKCNNVDYKLFSVYPKEDKEQNPYNNLEVVSCKPEQIIFIAFPLAILFYLFKWFKPLKALLLKNKILRGFYECDFVVDAAGISYVDSRGFIMNTYNFICTSTPLLVGKDVIKFSQAMGPFKTFWNRLWGNLALPKVEKICARGEITKKHLKDLGLKNIELCADGAFSMLDDEKATEYVNSVVRKDKFYSNEIIGLSISSVVDGYCRKNGIDYIGIMTRFINYLNKKGYGVLIIANAARKGKIRPKNNDLVVCQKVYEQVANKDMCRWYPEEFTPEIIRDFISKTKILVASRFHAMIGALEKQVPVLLIGWSHKYKEVLDMFEIGDYATDYKKLDYNNLVEQFERLENEYFDVENKIKRNLPKVKQSSYKNIEIIVDKIKSI